MKVTFEFEGVDDAYDLKLHQRVNEMYSAITEISDKIRSCLKYSDLNHDVLVSTLEDCRKLCFIEGID